MGRQSSRIIWGKTQKNPDESGYNLVYITDYDPENIYTSGNIVIAPETSYGAVEEDYKAWQCVASEAAGEFASWDESIWKELKGIKPIGKVVYIPDTEAQQIINPKRNVYRPGAKIIKLDKNGNHYLYKCIQENNIQVEGWVPSKWEAQMQRVGIAWIPRDHKDVYYNGKYHWAMWMMPEEFDDDYGEEISLYDPEVQYFKNEYCICPADEEGNRPLKLYKYMSQYPNRGIFPPYNSSLEPDESGTWMEMKDVSEHIDHQSLGTYPKDTKIIYEEYNQEEAPASDFVSGREYDKTRNHTCLHLIKPMGGSVSDKDHEILTATGDYTRTASGGGYDYTPVTDYAKKIEGGYPIYGYYEIDENAPERFIDSYFDVSHWHLKTLTKQREGYSIRIAIKEWSLVTSRDEGYEYGDIVIFSVPNSDAYGVYTCLLAHHADSPTYLPTEVPESYNSGTLDAKQPTDTHYWRLRKETYIDRGIHLYKAVRLTAKYNLNRKDWVVQTQNKHCDLEAGDEVWGFIWKKYGWSSGGNPFYFPMLIPGLLMSSGSTYSRSSRLCSFYPFMGDNVLDLTGTILRSSRRDGEWASVGTYVDTMHATFNGIFAYASYMDCQRSILIWKNEKNWKSYSLDDYCPVDLMNLRYAFNISFYAQNTLLLGMYNDNRTVFIIYKFIFMDVAVVCTKIAELAGHTYATSFDGYMATFSHASEIHHHEWEIGGQTYSLNLEMDYTYLNSIDIEGRTTRCAQRALTSGRVEPGFTEWEMDSYFNSNCRIVSVPYNIEGFIWEYLDNYDIKTDLVYSSKFINPSTGQVTATAVYELVSMGPTEEHFLFQSALGDNCYALKNIRYCYINTNNEIVVYFKSTITQIINGNTVVTRVISLGENPINNVTKIPNPEAGGIDIDGTIVYVDEDQLAEGVGDPLFNVIQLGKFLFMSNNLYYFADDRILKGYDPITGELTAFKTAVSSGIWELNISSGEANLVVDCMNKTDDWTIYRKMMLWNTILKIPCYGNQTCTVGGHELKYLYIGSNVYGLYQAFPDEYPDIQPLIGNKNTVIDGKLWIDFTGNRCSAKCSADTGYPIQNDTDLVTQQYLEVSTPDSGVWKIPFTLILVLPNYYDIKHYDNALRGYDPITNGAFFFLSSDDPSKRVAPSYGDPTNNAQGFSGW